MSNFDSNKWYSIRDSGDLSLVGTYLFDHDGTTGTVFVRITDTTDPEQLWQIYTINSTFVVMRTQATGPGGFLSAGIGRLDDDGSSDVNSGDTLPYTAAADLFDNSFFWQISPWGDGSFYFTNAQNGTDWHMQIEDSGLIDMSSDIQKPQPGQEFTFVETKDIDDENFSTVSLPTQTRSPPTSRPTQTMSQTTSSASQPGSTEPPPQGAFTTDTPSDSGSGGLSTGAAAGIGIGVAVVILGALILGLLLWRRRRRQHSNAPPIHHMPPPQPQAAWVQQPAYPPVELGAETMGGLQSPPPKYPPPAVASTTPNKGRPAELEPQEYYGELPGDTTLR